MERLGPKMFVEVLLDQNLAKRLDYLVPAEWEQMIQTGMRVEVPLKNNLVKGTIASIKASSQTPGIRPISRLLSNQGELTEPQWKLAHWIARYYGAPLQRVLKCFIPPHVREGVERKKQLFVELKLPKTAALSACETLRKENPEEAIALDLLFNTRKKGVFLMEFPDKTAVKRLLKKKIVSIEAIPLEEDLLLEADFFQSPPKKLNLEQKECLDVVRASLEQNIFAAHLIYGVTGSGKTEVYLQAIETALKLGKGTILLVPEVSLTSQTIERFRSRFSDKIAILHHRRSLGERNQAWEKLRQGEVRIAIGARSAIFAPMPNLGLIIVDEEHDSSYKQSDEIPCYHARNVAVMRAHIESATILLGSATPSIESRYNADIGKYQLHLLTSRANDASLPTVRIIDMKQVLDKHKGFTHFSQELLDGIEKRCKQGEQTLLFLNKRGYHRLQICGQCRFIIKCPHCDLGLTFHREAHLLKCHLCDYQRPSPRQCPSCNGSEPLQFKGFGTEHVERSLHAIFPSIRTLRMDRDTTRQKNSHDDLFKQFRSHKADVLIGTQMIAKGFHFPAVTLVGVLGSDATLSIPDFRSSESLFQLFTQVAGRAGRAELKGEVILQTFLPDHPIIKLAASQDYPSFYKAEIEERRLFGYPPFTHLIKCLFSAPTLASAQEAAQEAYAQLKAQLPQNAQALPPAASGHPKVKDLYRFQFLIKTARIEPVIPILTAIASKAPRSIQIKIDVDPLSTFF